MLVLVLSFITSGVLVCFTACLKLGIWIDSHAHHGIMLDFCYLVQIYDNEMTLMIRHRRLLQASCSPWLWLLLVHTMVSYFWQQTNGGIWTVRQSEWILSSLCIVCHTPNNAKFTVPRQFSIFDSNTNSFSVQGLHKKVRHLSSMAMKLHDPHHISSCSNNG